MVLTRFPEFCILKNFSVVHVIFFSFSYKKLFDELLIIKFLDYFLPALINLCFPVVQEAFLSHSNVSVRFCVVAVPARFSVNSLSQPKMVLDFLISLIYFLYFCGPKRFLSFSFSQKFLFSRFLYVIIFFISFILSPGQSTLLSMEHCFWLRFLEN